MNILEKIYKALRRYFFYQETLQEQIEAITLHLPNLENRTLLHGVDSIISVRSECQLQNGERTSVLIVENDLIKENWLQIKESSIPNSGLGVFSMRNFEKNEFITVYLGKIDLEQTDITYKFRNIDGLNRENPLDNYWYAHRIQHGSGERCNVRVLENYLLRATRKIREGDELFLDYHRDIFCQKCGSLSFAENFISSVNNFCECCGYPMLNGKKCVFEEHYYCLNCYDVFQINI
jgi:hypothetical protein